MHDVICHKCKNKGTQEQHDQSLDTVLERISKAGVTLNADKFSQTSVHLLGQFVHTNGICPDPEIKAVHAMEQSTNVTKLQCFLGMVNLLAKAT